MDKETQEWLEEATLLYRNYGYYGDKSINYLLNVQNELWRQLDSLEA